MKNKKLKNHKKGEKFFVKRKLQFLSKKVTNVCQKVRFFGRFIFYELFQLKNSNEKTFHSTIFHIPSIA